MSARRLPEGTVTFLRSDIEGSMELGRALGARYDEVNAQHAALVRAAVASHDGHVIRTEGDAFFVTFWDAADAARAAIDTQRALASQRWPAGQAVRVRIGLHTGAASLIGEDYGGFEVSRAARVAAAGWGGQIILSDPTRALLEDVPDPGWTVRSLGRHRLKGLAQPEPLFQLEAPGLTTEFPPLRSRAESDHLPERPDRLIGRTSELVELDRLLHTTSLLTLTGPGGSGKTTLALELARRQAGEYADGAYLVDLQAIREVALVKAEVARGIGLLDGPTGSAADRLAGYLADRELLIVIDNFEQVSEAAGVVAEILRTSARSRVIATSRVPLKLRSEQEYPVQPLPVESAGNTEPDAVRLFLDRARRARPEMVPSAADGATIAEICRRVDGLPLAIELCAARTASLGLPVILERLRSRQPLPGSGPRDLPDRQRTIDETVAWSVDLLEPSLQRLWARLAIFEESFDLEQARAVAGDVDGAVIDVLDGIVGLTESSLLLRLDDPAGGSRHGWLQTVRDHAVTRLASSGEADEMRARHVRAFADLAAAAAPHLPGALQRQWLERLAADDANLRAATIAAIELGDVASAQGLVAGLWRHWLQSGRVVEAQRMAARAMALPGAEAPTVTRVRALDAVGSLAYWTGDMGAASASYEEQLALAQHIGDRQGEALALLNLFFVRADTDPASAEAARAQAASIMAQLGDTFGLARLRQSALVLRLGGRLDEVTFSTEDLEAEAAAAEATGDAWIARAAPAMRGYALLQGGAPLEALRQLTLTLRANLALAERTDTAQLILFAVAVAPALDRPDIAAEIHGAWQAAFEQLGAQPLASYAELVGSDPIPAVEAMLGPEAFVAAVERGRRLTLEEAVDRIEEILRPGQPTG